MIFSYFAVKEQDQPRVLKWGILGVLLFRGALITAGYQLIVRFDWILYGFALLLVWAAYKMLTHGDEEIHPEQNPVLLLAKRTFPIVNRYEGSRFFTRENGRLVGTALLVVLIVIESTDVVFALDSIPAVFAIFTHHAPDFFIIFTSNMFAILGLRALFFVVAGAMAIFRFLKVGVAAILFFIAGKTLVKHWIPISEPVSLAIIGGVLLVAIVASVVHEEPPADETKKTEAGGSENAPAPAKIEEKA
jgi:tellurite resistance protein TerC